MTTRLHQCLQRFFIERCTQLLVPGGGNCPAGLHPRFWSDICEWLIKTIASIDLHDTFRCAMAHDLVLILQKKTDAQKAQEERSGNMSDYNIFMAMIEKVGHDKRGNPLFKRDKEGNEILVPDTDNVMVLGKTGEGDRTVSHERKRKVEDDQTPDVPSIFSNGKYRGLVW